jgi:hypothetical protein
VALVLAPTALDGELTARTLHPGIRVLAVVENPPSGTAVCASRDKARGGAQLPTTIVVTWSDRSARFLACSRLATRISSVDAASWECDSASELARALTKLLREPPGLTHDVRKGRPWAVARELARNDDGATIVVVSRSSPIGDWPRRLWSTFRWQSVAVLLDRAMSNPETGRVSR